MALQANANANAYKTVGKVNGYMKPFWLEPSNKDVMGYMLQDVAKGDWIPQGYPVKCVEDGTSGQKKAYLCKYMQVVEKVDNKNLHVKRNSLAKVGETYIVAGAAATGEPAVYTVLTITAIARDGEYDKVTFSANHGITTACTLYKGTAASGADYLPNRVIAEDCNITAEDKTVVAAHSGIILKNIVNYPAEYINSTAFPGSDLLVGCPLISFINQ